MAASRIPNGRIILIGLLMVLLSGLAGLQVWSALATRDMVREAIETPLGPGETDIQREKDRQEAIGKRIENRSKALLLTNLASAMGAGLGVAVSASGALLALFSYFSSREKERIDRKAAQDKDHQDRLAAALTDTLDRLSSSEPRQRAVGAAGLLPFFTTDRAEFHLQAFSTLMAAIRSESEDREAEEKKRGDDEPGEISKGLLLALEQALQTVAKPLLHQVSWRVLRLRGVNLAGADLTGLDLRDAVFRDAMLEGARLRGCDLTAAKLQGAKLAGADLGGANLTYADLAGANFAGADLTGARLENAAVLNLDLKGADLRGLEGWRGVPWDATLNWREAQFDDDVRKELEERYGKAAPDVKVLMLMWEAPPFVAGGTWTACYHLVRRLKRRGMDVTVVIPWDRDLVEDSPFDLDVPIVALGITPPSGGASVYGGAPGWSPYGSAGIYGGPYGGGLYGGVYGASAYGPYAGGTLAGSVLFRLIGEFSRRLESVAAELQADVIHAHDWVTFRAAATAANLTRTPWVAHFHSTEHDRRPDAADPLTLQVEDFGVEAASFLVAPSHATRDRLIADHGPAAERTKVAPNLLSDEPPPTYEMGRFETRRVVFVGRLSAQKGLDRFGELAQAVRYAAPGVSFDVFGDGEDRALSHRYGLNWRGALPWRDRGRAFSGATVVVVPSRSEPFGMVVLEAMQHRVPVIYPKASGAAEVLEAGVKVDPSDIEAMAERVVALLGDLGEWERVVRKQAEEIDKYARVPHDQPLLDVWEAAGEEPYVRVRNGSAG